MAVWHNKNPSMQGLIKKHEWLIFIGINVGQYTDVSWILWYYIGTCQNIVFLCFKTTGKVALLEKKKRGKLRSFPRFSRNPP